MMLHAIIFVPRWNVMKKKVEEEGTPVTADQVSYVGNEHATVSSEVSEDRYTYLYRFAYTNPEEHTNF